MTPMKVKNCDPITALEMQQLHGANEVAQFMDTLMSEMRGIQFGQRDTASVWVYYPNDIFSLGWIGFGDYRDSGDQPPTFVVNSRHIENKKYNSAYSELQHRMKMSVNIDTAITSAKKFLRPWTTHELARHYWGECGSLWSRAKMLAEEPLTDLKNKVFDVRYGSIDKPHHKELIHLAKTGHQFLDAEFHNNITAFIQLQDELKDLHTPRQHKFIRVYQKFGGTYADIVYVDASNYRVDLLNFMTYAEADVPEEDIGRISVLQMANEGDYILNIGCNMGDGVFYATV